MTIRDRSFAWPSRHHRRVTPVLSAVRRVIATGARPASGDLPRPEPVMRADLPRRYPSSLHPQVLTVETMNLFRIRREIHGISMVNINITAHANRDRLGRKLLGVNMQEGFRPKVFSHANATLPRSLCL